MNPGLKHSRNFRIIKVYYYNSKINSSALSLSSFRINIKNLHCFMFSRILFVNQILYALCILFLYPVVLQAQITVELDSITVTASRISTTISESGKSVSIYTQKEIEQMPVNSVDDLLRSLPGVNINGRQGFGVQADVGIRGSTFNQVLFMLDNTPLNDPLTAHFNTNIPVSLSEIGQVELIRGPASTSYGADAVGGVVHIKTKMYLEREIQSGDAILNRLDVDLSAGQNNLRMADVAVELLKNRIRFSSSVRTNRSDGEIFSNPGFEEGVSSQQSYNSFFDVTNYTAAFSYRLSDSWSWYMRGGIDERDFNARYFYTRSIFDESVEEISSKWGLSTLSFNRGNHKVELNSSYRSLNDIFDFNSDIAPVNEHTTNMLFLNLSHQYSIRNVSDRINSIRFMTGAQYLDKQIESTDRGDHQEAMGGIYAIASTGWANGLHMTSSLRLQFDALGRADLLPQFSAAYNIQAFTLRGSIGRAIRVGDFTERYISSQIPNLTPLRNIGNPDLEPEKSVTVDGGVDWRPTQNLRFSQTLFYRSSSNLIDYALTNESQITNANNLQAGEDYFYASNISSTEALGFEWISDGTLHFNSNNRLNLRGGYTYIRTTGSGETISRYIANHPSHQVSVGVRFQSSRFMVNSQSNYNVRSPEAEAIVDGNVPSSYFVTNLNFSVIPFRSDIRFYTRIMNLTDTQYQEILGAPLPGRWVMGGVQFRL